MTPRFILLVSFIAGAISLLAAETVWVDRARGDDANDGSREHPLATIDKGLAQCRPGTTMHVLPGDEPYPAGIRVMVNGTVEAPIVIDGHGSIVSGRGELPPDAWKDEGDGVYSRPLRNNAWGMERHWEGGFPLVWFDGEPGRNAASREELQPGGYFLYKNRQEMKTDPLHNTLFIRLPEGKGLVDVHLESIVERGGIYVAGNHVTIRNFICEYGGTDAFATHRNKGVVFEHVEGRYYMDQGMSHHGAEVTVRYAHFHHNAGCGIVDVYDEVKVRYENCLIEDDTWRGGVELLSGAFQMENCIIRRNPGKALAVSRAGQATLRNCHLIGPENERAVGVRMANDSRLTMENCTLTGFRTAVNAVVTPEAQLTLRHCAIRHAATNLLVVKRREAGDAAFDLGQGLELEGNAFSDGDFLLRDLAQDEETRKWTRKDQRFPAADAGAFAKAVGITFGEPPDGVGADPALLATLPDQVGPETTGNAK